MWDSAIEWLIIIVAVLVLFGSTKKIPDFARNLGRATGEFKRGQVELENELKKAMYGKPDTPKENEVNYVEAAKNLGIDTTNKTQDQLFKEISDKFKNSGQ